MTKKGNDIRIRNKKAYFHYHILETYNAGVQLMGLDIKSIRSGKVGLSEAYCNFINSELYISNMHLVERDNERLVLHKNRTHRKLLLNRRELNKWLKRVTEKGLSIVPLTLYFSDNGYVKIEIALVKGKREYDKRHSLKNEESKREIDRFKKANLSKYK